jgi:hypothetical protein
MPKKNKYNKKYRAMFFELSRYMNIKEVVIGTLQEIEKSSQRMSEFHTKSQFERHSIEVLQDMKKDIEANIARKQTE